MNVSTDQQAAVIIHKGSNTQVVKSDFRLLAVDCGQKGEISSTAGIL